MVTKFLSVMNRINVLKLTSKYDAASCIFSCRCAYYSLNKAILLESNFSYILKHVKPIENTCKQNNYKQFSVFANLSLSGKGKTAFSNTSLSTSQFQSQRKRSTGTSTTLSFTPYVTFGEDMLFRQLLEYKSYTYTYLLADVTTNEAVLIDPVIDTVDRDVRLVFELGLNLLYAVNTHVHADHITGSGSIKKMIPLCKSVIAEVSNAKADIKLKEGDIIKFGKFQLEARSTPGHTDGCMSFVWHEKGMVFTGDALLIRGCGRTDFQQGNPGTLYDSVHKKILSLPQHFKVFPGHDYTGQTMSSVGEELRFNSRLTKPRNEFIEIMGKLNLPYPKQIDKALPANMVCGVFDEPVSR